MFASSPSTASLFHAAPVATTSAASRNILLDETFAELKAVLASSFPSASPVPSSSDSTSPSSSSASSSSSSSSTDSESFSSLPSFHALLESLGRNSASPSASPPSSSATLDPASTTPPPDKSVWWDLDQRPPQFETRETKSTFVPKKFKVQSYDWYDDNLQHYALSKKKPEMMLALEAMKVKKMVPQVKTYNMIFNFLGKSGDLNTGMYVCIFGVFVIFGLCC